MGNLENMSTQQRKCKCGLESFYCKGEKEHVGTLVNKTAFSYVITLNKYGTPQAKRGNEHTKYGHREEYCKLEGKGGQHRWTTSSKR